MKEQNQNTMKKKNIDSQSAIIKSVIVILGYASYYLVRALPIIPLEDGSRTTIAKLLVPKMMYGSPVLESGWKNLVGLIPLAIFMLILHPAKDVMAKWGMPKEGFVKGMAIGFMFTIPMFVTNAIFGRFEFSWDAFLVSLMAGVFEEIIFRGYLFGQFFLKCRWPYVWASIIPAIVFGMGHLYQAHDPLAAALTFLVTAFGSFYFGWLFIEWNRAIWVAMSLHFFMDLAWMWFPVSGGEYGATGNLVTNIGRLVTLVLSIAFTIWYKRRKGQKCFAYRIV